MPKLIKLLFQRIKNTFEIPASRSSTTWSAVSGIFRVIETCPIRGLRSVVADLIPGQTSRNGGYGVKWIRLLPPQMYGTLSAAAKGSIDPRFRDERVLWQQQIGQYGFSLASYRDGQKRYVNVSMARHQNTGRWAVVPNGINQPIEITPAISGFNVYPLESSGDAFFGKVSVSYSVQVGLVVNPSIVKMRLIFSNGKHVLVPVVHGAFGDALVALHGKSMPWITKIVPLDAQGDAVSMRKQYVTHYWNLNSKLLGFL